MYVLALVLAVGMFQAAPPASGTGPEPRVPEVESLAAASDNDARFEALTALLRAHHLAFTLEPFTIDKAIGAESRTRGRNVVVSIGEGGRPIIVGAHYDAVRLADGSLSHGAVDDGAACVMLIHVAEALRDMSLPARVTFVWFDMEEGGLIGSARYVDAHPADRPRAMLNFDIDGYGDAVVFGHPPGGDDPHLRQVFADTCARQEVDCQRFPSLPYGDDRSFGKARIPTLSVASLSPTEMHQLWLLMNAGANSGMTPGATPEIFRIMHTANDVVTKVDPATLIRMERLTVALVGSLSRLP